MSIEEFTEQVKVGLRVTKILSPITLALGIVAMVTFFAILVMREQVGMLKRLYSSRRISYGLCITNMVATVAVDILIAYDVKAMYWMRSTISENLSPWMALTDSLEQKLGFIDLKSEYSDIYLMYLVISVVYTAVTLVFFRTVLRELKRLWEGKSELQDAGQSTQDAVHLAVEKEFVDAVVEPVVGEAVN